MKILVDGDDPGTRPGNDPETKSIKDSGIEGLPDFVQKRYNEPMQQNGNDSGDTETVPTHKEVIEDIKNRPEKNTKKKATMYVALAFVMVAIIIGIMMYVNLKENGKGTD